VAVAVGLIFSDTLNLLFIKLGGLKRDFSREVRSLMPSQKSCAVGRMTTSSISTSAGCSMA